MSVRRGRRAGVGGEDLDGNGVAGKCVGSAAVRAGGTGWREVVGGGGAAERARGGGGLRAGDECEAKKTVVVREQGRMVESFCGARACRACGGLSALCFSHGLDRRDFRVRGRAAFKRYVELGQRWLSRVSADGVHMCDTKARDCEVKTIWHTKLRPDIHGATHDSKARQNLRPCCVALTRLQYRKSNTI